MTGITFSKLSTTTPAGTRVRRLFDGLVGTLVRIDPATDDYPHDVAYVDLGRGAHDTWAGVLGAWELEEPRPMATTPTLVWERHSFGGSAPAVLTAETGTWHFQISREGKRVRLDVTEAGRRWAPRYADKLSQAKTYAAGLVQA